MLSLSIQCRYRMRGSGKSFFTRNSTIIDAIINVQMKVSFASGESDGNSHQAFFERVSKPDPSLERGLVKSGND